MAEILLATLPRITASANASSDFDDPLAVLAILTAWNNGEGVLANAEAVQLSTTDVVEETMANMTH